jgi:hypothetical protein
MNAHERERHVQELLAQKLSQKAIPRISGIPRRTMQRIIKRLEQRDASRLWVRVVPHPPDRSAHRFDQRANDLQGTMREPAAEKRREETDVPVTPPNQSLQGPGDLPARTPSEWRKTTWGQEPKPHSRGWRAYLRVHRGCMTSW